MQNPTVGAGYRDIQFGTALVTVTGGTYDNQVTVVAFASRLAAAVV